MNARLQAMLLSTFLLGGAAARADEPTLRFEDHADHVAVVARGVTLAPGHRPEARGVWIDVPLQAAERTGSRLLDADRTVKRADVSRGDSPRISVLLHHAMPAADWIANTTVEALEGGRVVVRIPRDKAQAPRPVPVAPVIAAPAEAPHPVDIAPGRRPAPAVDVVSAARAPAPVAAAAPAAPAPRAGDPLPGRAAAVAAAPAAPAAITGSAAATPVAAAPLAGLPVAGEPLGVPGPEDHGLALAGAAEVNATPLYVVMLLLSTAGVVAMLFARRRRQGGAPAPLLRVVSTCQLAPKVKVMLVAVGDREMLLSVGESGAVVLARWSEDEGGAALTDDPSGGEPDDEAHALLGRGPAGATPTAARAAAPRAPTLPPIERPSRPSQILAAVREVQALDIPDIDVEAPAARPAPAAPPTPRGAPSPAVAGLLKLRHSAAAPVPAAAAVAVADAVTDERWARELLAAMRSPGPEGLR